jgi:hypothetical protein
VEHGYRLRVQYEGDRAFEDLPATVGECGGARRDIGNCVRVPTPAKRRDRTTLGLHLGTGLAIAAVSGPPTKFYSPTLEVGLHVLRRLDESPLDFEVSAMLAVQRWKTYATDFVQSDSPKEYEAAPLMLLGLEPGMRFRFLHSWFAGFSLFAGWGGPSVRRVVSTISDQFVFGTGGSFGYAWSRTVALEVRPRFLWAAVRSAAFDAGGLVAFDEHQRVWLLQVPLVVRFDDIVGY